MLDRRRDLPAFDGWVPVVHIHHEFAANPKGKDPQPNPRNSPDSTLEVGSLGIQLFVAGFANFAEGVDSLFDPAKLDLFLGFGWWSLPDWKYGCAVWSVVDDLSVGSSLGAVFAVVFGPVVVFAADGRVVGVGSAVTVLPFVDVVDFGICDWNVAAAKVAAVGHEFGCFAGCTCE